MPAHEHVGADRGAVGARAGPGPGGDAPTASGPHRAAWTVHSRTLTRTPRHWAGTSARVTPGESRPRGRRGPTGRGRPGRDLRSRYAWRRPAERHRRACGHLVPPGPAPGRPPGPAGGDRLRRPLRSRPAPRRPAVRDRPRPVGRRRRPAPGLVAALAARPGRAHRGRPGGAPRRPGARRGRGGARDRCARGPRECGLRPVRAPSRRRRRGGPRRGRRPARGDGLAVRGGSGHRPQRQRRGLQGLHAVLPRVAAHRLVRPGRDGGRLGRGGHLGAAGRTGLARGAGPGRHRAAAGR